MYRLADFATAEEAFHFFVANLVHRGGWTFIDGQLGGAASYVLSWPLPTDASAVALVATTDFAVLKAPDANLSLNGDHVKITFLSATPDIVVRFMRREDGTELAWDPATHAEFDIANTQTPVSDPTGLALDMSNAGGKVFVFSDSQSLVMAHINTTTHALFNGCWAGYLETLVLGEASPTPLLGAGDDPYPLVVLDLTADAGEGFDEAGSLVAVRNLTALEDTTTDDLHTNPIPWGGGVEKQVLTQYVVLEDGGTHFARGVAAAMYLTTSATSLQVLRLPGTSTEFVTIEAGKAVGPIG